MSQFSDIIADRKQCLRVGGRCDRDGRKKRKKRNKSGSEETCVFVKAASSSGGCFKVRARCGSFSLAPGAKIAEG